MSHDPVPPATQMRLRYAGRCKECTGELAAGTVALYSRATKSVTCVPCASATAAPPPAAAEPTTPTVADRPDGPDPTQRPLPSVGVAGASAQQEYERRKSKREARIREAHPRVGGLLLALTDDPQTTKAWAAGARGEELLGKRLDGLTEHGALVLHDRRIPGTRANIDHLVVAPSGVFVIDAKRYQGRPRLLVEGGLFRPRTRTLLVGTRDCTKLVAGVHKQMAVVTSMLADSAPDVPVHGFLCFVQADWPLVRDGFSIDGVEVLWPKRAAELLRRTGELDGPAREALHRRLAAGLPAAV